MNEHLVSKRPTDEDKKEYLEEHLVYEVEMLLYSFGQLTKCTNIVEECSLTSTQISTPNVTQFWGQSRDKNFGNMALETFLLHARNLREFFYKDDKGRPDDARAFELFMDKDPWKKLRPNETDSIKEVKNRADKELAHLTYKRISGTPPEKKWDCGKILFDLLGVVKVFLDKLPEQYFGENLKDLKYKVRLNIDQFRERR